MQISNNANKIFLTLVSLVISIFAITPAQASIQYGEESYTSSLAASTTNSVGSLVKDFSISNIDSAQSIGAGIGIVAKIGNFFNKINTWLKDRAGINLLAILTTIGHWFVITLEFIVKALKAIL